jgi:ADP-ribosylglycohydrolase
MDKITAKQVEAVLLGVAVGDALGVPVEFKPRGTFKVTDMVGYGTHSQPPGTWSDDTSLTLCLTEAMTRMDGSILEKTAENFIQWFEKGAFTARGNVFDIGVSTSKAIHRLQEGVPPTKSGSAEVNENGNGSLMRIAPLVFYVANRPLSERFEIVRQISAITHAHDWSAAACFIYIDYLRKLLGGMEKKAAYTELRRDFRQGIICMTTDTLGKFQRILKMNISALLESDIKSGGFVVDTLEAAMWCFLNTNNYRDAVLKAVNLGSDTDTTAAVVGGLAGLFYGVDSIPASWLKQLAQYDYFRDLSERLFRKGR